MKVLRTSFETPVRQAHRLLRMSGGTMDILFPLILRRD
jgi:hypothetical protein